MTGPAARPRIAVTGTGVVSCLGIGSDAFWASAVAGRDGIRDVTRFDTSGLRTHRAGEIADFRPADHLPPTARDLPGRASQLAVAAAGEALARARLAVGDGIAAERVAVVMGTTMGEPELLDEVAEGLVRDGLGGLPWRALLALPCHGIPAAVARVFGLAGPNLQIPTACAAGNYAVGVGCDLLRRGRADAVLAGGSDALSRIAVAGFNKLLAHAPDRCRPFDLDRSGMMVAEGAACLVLERLDDALARGAVVLAEVLDVGYGCDAANLTIPHPEGRGGRRALEDVLARTGVAPEEVDWVCAHGTGTRENDRVETLVLERVLGASRRRLPVSSLKSMAGHAMGAAAALEAVACVRALEAGLVPPTIHYQTPDPECDLDVVPDVARRLPLKIVASNAYAFGGNCSTLLLRRWPQEEAT